MKIDYVLMGSTTDPLYFDFWPIVSKIWKEKFNIIPVLGLICDEDSDFIETEYGLIKKFKTSNISTAGNQSQIVRMYLGKYLSGNCIISDIDMFPLSKKYFINGLEKYEDNDIVVMSSHHPQTHNINQYPMCYVVGNSKIFDKLFETNISWEEFLEKTLINGWYSDQNFLYQSIQSFGVENVKFPKRDFLDDRIDRDNWKYDINLLKEEKYIDCHSLRPVSQYRFQIEQLISLII